MKGLGRNEDAAFGSSIETGCSALPGAVETIPTNTCIGCYGRMTTGVPLDYKNRLVL
jgi:hypothetical protein